MQLPPGVNRYLTGENFPHKDPRKGKYILQPVHSITSALPNGAGPGVRGWSPLPYSPQEDPNRVPFSQVFSSLAHQSSQQPSQARSFQQQEIVQLKQSKLNANAPEFVLSSVKASPNHVMAVRSNLLIDTRRGWSTSMGQSSSQCQIPKKIHGVAPKSQPHYPRNRANVFKTHIAAFPRNFTSVGGLCPTNLPRNYKLMHPGDNTGGSDIPRDITGRKSSLRYSGTYHNEVTSSVPTTSGEGSLRGEDNNPNNNSRNGAPNKSRVFHSKEGHCEGKHGPESNMKQACDINLKREEGACGSQNMKVTGRKQSRGGRRRNPLGNNYTLHMKPWVPKRRTNGRYITHHYGATIIRQYSGKLANLGLDNQMQIIVLQKCASTIGLLPHSIHTIVLQECNVDIKKMKANISTLIVEDCSPRLDYLPSSLRNLVLLRSSSSLDYLPQSIQNLIICDSSVNLDRLPDTLREIALRKIFADQKLLPSKAVILELWGKGTQNLSDQAMVRIMASVVTWVPSELLMVVADYAVEKVGYLHNISELARGEWRRAFAEYQLLERQVLNARRMLFNM